MTIPLQLSEGNYFGKEMRSVECTTFKCTLAKYAPFTAIEEHCHENDYISLLLDGRYDEKSGFGTQLLEAGDTIFRPAHYAHSHALKTNGYHCFNIEFKKNWQQGLNYHFELPDDRVIYKAGSSPGIYKLFCYFINNIPQDFLEETLLDWVFESNPRSAKFRSLPWLEKVVAILERESDIHHTIHSISGRVFVHPIYLSGAFKKRTGYTISEYQLKIKAEKAFSLLLSTNLPVAEVALKAGFYDSPHLINSFKLAYGSSPGKLRAKVKKLI